MVRFARFALAALLQLAASAEQTIILRDGTRLYGRVTGAAEHSITFADPNGGIHTLDNDRIDLIRFEHREGGPSRSYSAQVSQDVVDASGNIAIARGSDARLIVRRLNDGVLALDLQSVAVNGHRYRVDTGDVVQGSQRDGVGENKRTAEFGGGGAVGIGTEIATREPIVRVPSETVLNFRLDNAVSLRAARSESQYKEKRKEQ